MAKKTNWIVTTSGDRSLDEVEKKLAAEGFAIDQVLGAIGCITGAASADVVGKVRRIPGVADVSPEPPPIDIGPPDAAIS
jgi:hypothetical protein